VPFLDGLYLTVQIRHLLLNAALGWVRYLLVEVMKLVDDLIQFHVACTLQAGDPGRNGFFQGTYACFCGVGLVHHACPIGC
jgi:hypothetical protein